MTFNKGPGKWCPENDGAYQAEQAAIHGSVKHEGTVTGRFTDPDADFWGADADLQGAGIVSGWELKRSEEKL